MADYSYNFDDNTAQGWTIFTDGAGITSVLSAAAGLGGSSYGVRIATTTNNGNSAGLGRALPASYADIYYQFRLRINAGSAMQYANKWVNFLYFATSNQWNVQNVLQLFWNGTVWSARPLDGSGTVNLPFDTDLLVEVRRRRHATAGGLQVWVNGTLVIDDLTHNTDTSDIGFIRQGLMAGDGSWGNAVSIDIDEIQVAAAYIGSAGGFTMSYNGNGSNGGTAPTDASSPYAENADVTVLGPGTLTRTGYTFARWDTAADGSGTTYDPEDIFAITENTTLFAQWTLNPPPPGTGITIDHTNFDPASFTAEQIAAAAALDVYFEHASTGQDITGTSSTDSSTGLNYDDSDDCGLAELYALNNRYLCDRLHFAENSNPYNDPTWFATHGGLQTYRRGNPSPSPLKLSGFVTRAGVIAPYTDVCMFKFCWIDAWSGSGITDGTAFAATMIAAIEQLEAENPTTLFPYWTMPLQSNAGYAVRDNFNTAIRAYCLENDKWLLDMADIQNFDDSGTRAADVGGYRAAVASYVISDGGHLSSAGRVKMARAYWSMLAFIANGGPVYTISDVTRDKDGEALGSVRVSLFSNSGSGVFAYVGTTVSNSTTGAFSFTVPDGETEYMLYYHLPGTPNVYDASDNNVVGVLP